MKRIMYVAIAFSFLACKKEMISQSTTKSMEGEKVSASVASLAPANYAIVSHKATPQQTDAQIVTVTFGNATQYAYLPQNAGVRKDKLMIFVPGTIGVPSGYDEVCKAAARNGYYAFAVAYSNRLPIETQEGRNPNDSTVKNILNEYLTGENTSAKVNVSRANSFENRIVKMIAYLDSLYPAENWKRFLTAGKGIQWNKISVGGHSQGSDHVMYWSKVRPLARAGFFGGPGGFQLDNGSYPSFIGAPGATPSDSLYGFNGTNDEIRPFAGVKPVWALLGLPGEPNSVDDGLFEGAHQLYTSKAKDGHSGPIMDTATPIDATGKPAYEPVWRYMLFP